MTKNLANKELTDLLLKTRQDRGYSLHQASYKTGVSHSFISQLERGLRPTPIPDVLRKIAKGYNLNYELLMQKAGYLDEVRDNQESSYDPYEMLMFSDKESFEAMPKEEQERILTVLREQADFLIEKAKRKE
ncbi:helix-turn-helix domain-containing protein [Mammaliicoccus sciuri]|uniref:helix-turn-helix domain-containing protein n=1 Tax=Mammaliicoccus sciuri TaxID=1296 RepID=UPI001D0D4009|nr:helix-turn-helix domain-containing protein [Mammaliicoccus sciuri]MCC2087950.1 helix-turn-helix domain-containing protein [Mammaliicoccus sciuri]